MRDFTLSVIIPVYNAEKYLRKAVESAEGISEVKEIILVEDGSPDNALKVAEGLKLEYQKVKLFRHPDGGNHGAAASRNLGIQKATQPFIAFLDADDFYLPKRFEKDREVFQKYPDADGCYSATGAYFYSEEAKKIFLNHFGEIMITTVLEQVNPTPENLFLGLIGLNGAYGYFHLDALTLKRESLINNAICFNTELRLHQDTDFVYKIAYYLRLYPSEINQPVAMRGVHDENRITANYESDKDIRDKKRFLLWKSLYEWAVNENIDNRTAKQFFKDRYDSFRLRTNENPHPVTLFKEILINREILRNRDYREIHRLYTRKLGNKISFGLLKIRNFLIKTT